MLFLFVPTVSSSVFQLTSPSDFLHPSTMIDFDDAIHLQAANVLYLSEGVEFSRDDGQGVAIYKSSNPEMTTTSYPNHLATVGSSLSGYPASTWVTHLNAGFIVLAYEVGAYFGNDQGGDFNRITLSAYGENSNFLGSVAVNANNNTSVDQFIGLSSNELIHSVRFQNNGEWYAVAIDDFVFSPIPEPATLLLLGLGAFVLRRKR